MRCFSPSYSLTHTSGQTHCSGLHKHLLTSCFIFHTKKCSRLDQPSCSIMETSRQQHVCKDEMSVRVSSRIQVQEDGIHGGTKWILECMFETLEPLWAFKWAKCAAGLYLLMVRLILAQENNEMTTCNTAYFMQIWHCNNYLRNVPLRLKTA